MTENKKTESKAKEQNLWQEILRAAMTKKDLEDANIFIMGDQLTGKKSLIKVMNTLTQRDQEDTSNKLKLDELATKYGMVNYTYLNVARLSENDFDSVGKMGVWIVNDLVDKDTFQSLIKPEYLTKCICLIVVDLSQPWAIKESITKWLNFIYDNFSSLILKFPYEKQQEMREQLVQSVKLYEEPQFDEEGKYKKELLSEEQKQIKLELPLKDGVLSTNVGLPIGIIVNKSDIVNKTGEKNFYEENSEFILKHIRQIAISYGASIFYTSGKANININVLYDYIVHRLFGFDLTHRPNLSEKESFFIPAGYDSLSALRNSDTQNMLNVLYDEKIPVVKPKTYVKEEEIVCEETNVFLARMKNERPSRGHIATASLGNVREFIHKSRPSDFDRETSPGKFKKFLAKKNEEKKEDIKPARKNESTTTTKKEDKEKFNKTKAEMLKKLNLLKNKK